MVTFLGSLRQIWVMDTRTNFVTAGANPGAGQDLGFPRRPGIWVGRAFPGATESAIAFTLLEVGGGLRSYDCPPPGQGRRALQGSSAEWGDAAGLVFSAKGIVWAWLPARPRGLLPRMGGVLG